MDQERKNLLIGSGIVSAVIIMGLAGDGVVVELDRERQDQAAQRTPVADRRHPDASTLQAAMGTRKTTVASLVATGSPGISSWARSRR